MVRTKTIVVTVKKIGIVIGTVFLIMCMCLYIFQNKLICFPKNISILRMQEVSKMGSDIEEETIKAKDGITLKGWVVNKNSKNVVYYFGGNSSINF